jgi:hypothetical protein
MNDIATIAENLHTQDGRMTHLPIFMVQVKVRERGDPDNGDPYYWVNRDWERVDDEVGKRLDEAEEKGNWGFFHPDDADEFGRSLPRDRCDYTKVYYQDVYHHQMPFFTEQGAKDYIAVNGHNLREPRIYVESGYRNREWEIVREFLMSQRAEGWKS